MRAKCVAMLPSRGCHQRRRRQHLRAHCGQTHDYLPHREQHGEEPDGHPDILKRKILLHQSCRYSLVKNSDHAGCSSNGLPLLSVSNSESKRNCPSSLQCSSVCTPKSPLSSSMYLSASISWLSTSKIGRASCRERV